MKFDHTQGKEARYIVSIYAWNVNDMYYYHTFKDAKALYNRIKEEGLERGTILSISDMKKDIRKGFYKF